MSFGVRPQGEVLSCCIILHGKRHYGTLSILHVFDRGSLLPYARRSDVVFS